MSKPEVAPGSHPGSHEVEMDVIGQKIYLRRVQPSDANENYYRWMNDPQVIQYVQGRISPNTIQGLSAYVDGTINDPCQVFLAIVLRNNNAHVGNVKIGPIDWLKRTGDVGILIGEKSLWGQGIATESLNLVIDFAHKVLDLRRLQAVIVTANHGSIRAYEKAGFAAERVSNDSLFINGEYVDLVHVGISLGHAD